MQHHNSANNNINSNNNNNNHHPQFQQVESEDAFHRQASGHHHHAQMGFRLETKQGHESLLMGSCKHFRINIGYVNIRVISIIFFFY
jgi:hypothetical protein